MRRRRPLFAPLFAPPPQPAPVVVLLSLQTMASLFMFIILTPIIITAAAAAADDKNMTESEALMNLKQSLHPKDSLPPNWNQAGKPPPCTPDGGTNWGGVICSEGKVWGLQLENMHLSGNLNLECWRHLLELRTISLTNNEFDGPFPYKMVKSLPKLRSLYLSENEFSGKIPDDTFSGMYSLRRVLLSDNEFSGKIPNSLAKLPRLVELRLEGNQFQGRIPNFQMEDLSMMNVSNNQLEGPIPPNLKNVSAKAFEGNKGLCGPPMGQPCRILPPPKSHTPPPSSPSTNESPSTNDQPNNNNNNNNNNNPSPPSINVEDDMFLLMLCLAIAILLVLLLVIAALCTRRKQQQKLEESGGGYIDDDDPKKNQQKYEHKVVAIIPELETTPAAAGNIRMSTNDPYGGGGGKKGSPGKLVFVKEGYIHRQFDLAELLKASAEVLGSGNFGSAYKAAVAEDQSPMVVVKRYRQMNRVGRQEFHEHMTRMGRLKHPNVLPTLAYFFRKEEKLVLTEFIHNGSLSDHLHRDRRNHTTDDVTSSSSSSSSSSSTTTTTKTKGLDWPTRLRIVKGVARGLSYLDRTDAGYSKVLAHGHLKSSNVLLNESYDAVLCDHGLIDLINNEDAQQLLVSYKSPDFYKKGQIVRKTDVWCLGILILEVLTGTFPPNYLPGGGEMIRDTENLVSWVDEVASLVIMSQDSGDADCSSVTDSAMGRTEGGEREIRKLLDIGLSCCQIDIDKRWTIKEAAEKIEQIQDFSNNTTTFASLQDDAGVKLVDLA